MFNILIREKLIFSCLVGKELKGYVEDCVHDGGGHYHSVWGLCWITVNWYWSKIWSPLSTLWLLTCMSNDKWCLDYWSIYLRITSEQANAHRIKFFLKESIINMLVSLTHIMQLLRIYLPIKSVAIFFPSYL